VDSRGAWGAKVSDVRKFSPAEAAGCSSLGFLFRAIRFVGFAVSAGGLSTIRNFLSPIRSRRARPMTMAMNAGLI